MNKKMIGKVVLTLAIINGFYSSVSSGQTLSSVAGCTEADFVSCSSNCLISTVGTSYSPKCVRVKVGDTVTIQASQRHPLAAMPEINGVVNPFLDNKSFFSAQSRTMSASGIFGFFCEVHGDANGEGMAGAIIVE